MAYVDTQHEIIILYPYKTGTHSIRQIMTDNGRSPNGSPPEGTQHPSLEQLKLRRPDITNIYDWDVYAFYREPVDRFISWMAYKHKIYPEFAPTNTVMEFIGAHGIIPTQTRWLKHDIVNIKLLDFRNFEAELRRVLRRVGISPQTIPVLNESPNRRTPSELSAEEIATVKDFFKEDYDFFASKGITFNV